MNYVAYAHHARIDESLRADRKRITAVVIECPGQLRDDIYYALQINIEGSRLPTC